MRRSSNFHSPSGGNFSQSSSSCNRAEPSYIFHGLKGAAHCFMSGRHLLAVGSHANRDIETIVCLFFALLWGLQMRSLMSFAQEPRWCLSELWKVFATAAWC